MTGLGIALMAALAVAVLVPSMLFADRPVPFPGLESGARNAAEHGLAKDIDASASNDGIELKVVGFVADETETVVSYVLSGREDEGVAQNGSGTFLIDADGQSYRSTRGSADQNDPRYATAVFPPIPAKAGTLALEMDGLFIVSREIGRDVKEVSGKWKVEFDWDGKKAPPGPLVEIPAAPQAFGPGSIFITSIQQAATGTVVSGTLEGFSADAIQSMDCVAAPLTAAGGASIPWITCREGFGEGYRSFEIIYPPTTGKVALNFVLGFSGHGPPGTTVSPGYQEAAGAIATFELDLPPR